MYPIFNLSLTSIWSAVSSTKNSRPWWALNPSPPNSYAILVSGYLVWQLWINHDMDVQYRRCTYGDGATLLSFIEWGNVMTVTWQPKFWSMELRSLTIGAQRLHYYRFVLVCEHWPSRNQSLSRAGTPEIWIDQSGFTGFRKQKNLTVLTSMKVNGKGIEIR